MSDTVMSGTVLVIGVPRSGTTWLCEVLRLGREHEVVFEPDNEKTSWLGWRLKRHLPRFPTLAPGDTDQRFGLLWDYAFRGPHARALTSRGATSPLRLFPQRAERALERKENEAAAGGPHRLVEGQPLLDSLMFGGRRKTAPRIVKSVHIPFCAEWVVRESAPAKVVVIFRHPYGVIASMRRMAMHDSFRGGSLLRHLTQSERGLVRECLGQNGRPTDLKPIALMVLKMYQHLEDAAARHSDWTVIEFENLCAAPVESFHSLFERIGISWRDDIEAGIESMNRSGTGFSAHRVASQQIHGWKRELSSEEIDVLDETFSAYLAGRGQASGMRG